MKGVGGCDQRLGRHAANAGAHGPPRPVVDHREVLRALLHLTQRGQASAACSDDDDVQWIADENLGGVRWKAQWGASPQCCSLRRRAASSLLGAPLLHGLRAEAVDVNLLVDERHPAQGDEVVLARFVSLELDFGVAFHVIDDCELAVLRADDRHLGLDLLGVDHASLLQRVWLGQRSVQQVCQRNVAART
jgi:hypothetical protein